MNDRFEPDVLTKFIEAYKTLPCLWNRKHPGYRVRRAKQNALKKLLEVIKPDLPGATLETVEKKIGSIRACHRKERRRITLQSKGSKNRKKATLWYYDKLSFLDGDNARRNYHKSDDSECEEGHLKSMKKFGKMKQIKQESEEDDEPRYEETHEYEQSIDPAEYSMVEVADDSKQYQYEDDKSKRQCTEVMDEYDAIGINVAAKLRNLPSNMRILAEKLINDVLFQAQLNGLNASTVISTSDPFKQE